MRRFGHVLSTLAVVLLVTGLISIAAPTHARASVGSRPIKIMPLGDSITYGGGSSTGSSYRADLWNRLVVQAGYDIDFVGSQQSGSLPDTDNEGHSGWRIDQIAANINGWMATYQPDVVLLHIGTNDMNQNYQVSTAPQRLGALLDQILADRPATTILVAKIVPSTDPTIQSRIAAYNAALPAVVAARGSHAQLVDLSVLSTATDMSDALHPNDTGYLRMSVRWYSALENVLGDGRDWPLFTNGFEAGEAPATWKDTPAAAINVGGYCCGLTAMESSARTEGVAHGGVSALMYSGSDNSATQSYSYAELFSTDLPVTARGVLSYWIYPQQVTGEYVAVDLQLTDGSDLRDSGAVDQYGVRAHPQYQGQGGHLAPNTWNLVRVSLAPLAGRTISRIDVGFDRPTGTGTFRGYVDDLTISDEGGAYPGANLALHAASTGSAPCATTESADKAVDGVIAGNSKWCSGVGAATLQVDLGAPATIRRFVIRHAAAGGETPVWNTRGFTIAVSSDGTAWTTVVSVSANADGVTTNTVPATSARYARLTVITPTQDGSAPAARIYEFEIDGA